jgi:hypothetical protein
LFFDAPLSYFWNHVPVMNAVLVFTKTMRSSRKKREAQIKDDLSKPTAQQGLEELAELIRALTEQAD